jgi:hypothetical protein
MLTLRRLSLKFQYDKFQYDTAYGPQVNEKACALNEKKFGVAMLLFEHDSNLNTPSFAIKY